MNKHTEIDDKLERLLQRELRALPLLRAPRTLESRVLGELARRAALPWWQRSFANWPMGARVSFVLICVALSGATFLGGVSAVVGVRSLTEIGALLLSWIQPALVVMASAGGLAALLLHLIPPLWLYGGLAVGAMLYVTLFGLGAAAYRMLYRPSLAGDRL
jgi:hypothetical protein